MTPSSQHPTRPPAALRLAAPADERRSTALDGLRGVAALSVLVFHAWLYTRSPISASARATPLDYALHELRLGLVLFFVLSGFLLWRPFAAAARRGRPAPRTRDYLRRRAARVLPAYYVALAGSVALLWGAQATPGVRMPDLELLPLFVVFAQNFDPGTVMKLDPPMWTLAVEVSFYALLPLAALAAVRLPRRRAVQALLPLGLLAAGVSWNHAVAGSGSIVPGKLLPAMLPYFALGMLAALALDGRRALARRPALWLLAAGLLLVLADAAWQAGGAASRSGSYAYRIWRDLPAAAGFALVIAAVAGGGAGVAALRWRPLAALGTVSFGVYLWHVPLLLVARHLGVLPLETAGAAVVVLALTLPVAAASWRWVERPAIERARCGAPAGGRGAPAGAGTAARRASAVLARARG